MGRKAKPINLHIVEGNPNRLTKKQIEQRKKAEAVLTVGTDRVKPPAWLNPAAKREFNRRAKELLKVGLISNADIDALARLCDATVDYIEMTKTIAEEGYMVEYINKAAKTNKVPHPFLAKKKALHDQMLKLEQEFGLTPSARARLAIPKKEKKEPTAFEKRFGDRV